MEGGCKIAKTTTDNEKHLFWINSAPMLSHCLSIPPFFQPVLSESNYSLSQWGLRATAPTFLHIPQWRVLSLHCDLGHHQFSGCFVAFERCPISWVGTITPCLLPWKAGRAGTSSMRVPKVNLHFLGAELSWGGWEVTCGHFSLHWRMLEVHAPHTHKLTPSSPLLSTRLHTGE